MADVETTIAIRAEVHAVITSIANQLDALASAAYARAASSAFPEVARATGDSLVSVAFAIRKATDSGSVQS